MWRPFFKITGLKIINSVSKQTEREIQFFFSVLYVIQNNITVKIGCFTTSSAEEHIFLCLTKSGVHWTLLSRELHIRYITKNGIYLVLEQISIKMSHHFTTFKNYNESLLLLSWAPKLPWDVGCPGRCRLSNRKFL